MNSLLNKLFSKDLFTKMVLTLSLVLGATQAWGDDYITVSDGTNTNSFVPVYGNNLNNYFVQSEFIIPKASVSTIAKKQITALRFYISQKASSWEDARFTVVLKEVDAVGYYSSQVFLGTTDATTVYTGALDATGDYMDISFNGSSFIYSGDKNLLIGVYCTTKGTKSEAKFYGITDYTNYPGLYKASAASRSSASPKTTIYYTTPAPTTTLSIDPDEDVDFGTVWASDTKTDYYTITNNSASTVNVVASIGGTDASSFSVSPSEAQNIESGATQTYTISYTYNPSSLGEKSATITFTPDEDNTNKITKNITANAVSDFTISSLDGAFGTVTADANKVYTITNNTGATVNVTPSITGTNADMFSVSPSEETAIADGESQDFTVTFDWQAYVTKLGVKTATITFDPDNEYTPFVISASATATADVVIDENSETTWDPGSGKSVLVYYQPTVNWNTICVPFRITTYITDIFGSDAGAKFYYVSNYDNGVITITKQNFVSPSKPCIVYVSKAKDNTGGVLLTGVAVNNTTPGTTEVESTTYMQGTYTGISMYNKYGLTPSGKIMKGGSSSDLKGFHAYFTNVAPPTGESRVGFVIEDEEGGTTDLGFVKMFDENAKDVYTLSGQKVEKASKGIYIVNGRKVVIK